MNIAHLKYAVEVEKTASITKAAENLFMGQPNLSRGIKELEETLGVKIDPSAYPLSECVCRRNLPHIPLHRYRTRPQCSCRSL